MSTSRDLTTPEPGTTPSRHANWFTYFPEDYRWSAALVGVLGTAAYGGADIGEVDRIGRALRGHAGDDEAWFTEWRREGERMRDRAAAEEAAGHALTAAGMHLRACSYLQMGERFRTPKDALALDVYEAAVASFRRFAALTDGPRIEPVEVPYEDTTLPAYLVRPSAAEGPLPCVVYFDGLDVTKELQYLRGVPELTRRGLACLVVDGPGNGEAIRFRGLPLRPDYERAGSAALDHLRTRGDIDPDRVAVMALSLGGYYATRIAAMDPRYRACVAWGAIWDYHETWRRRVAQAFATQLSVPGHHIQWVLGAESLDDALRRLEPFRLAGVAEHVRCSYLLLHGAEDEQVPLEDARALYEAIGSTDKTLRVFTAAEGGAQHCQHDSLLSATPVIADWLAERLARAPGRPAAPPGEP